LLLPDCFEPYRLSTYKKVSAMKKMNKKGFSLIELIVVIAIIVAIAAIILPQVSSYTENARAAADQRNVQLWNQAYHNYFTTASAFGGAADANDTVNIADDSADIAAVNARVGTALTGLPANQDFNIPQVNLQAGTVTFADGTGLTYAAD
jgi:prepilin-type N-terminal cleavage/methylation domain-containing protein